MEAGGGTHILGGRGSLLASVAFYEPLTHCCPLTPLTPLTPHPQVSFHKQSGELASEHTVRLKKEAQVKNEDGSPEMMADDDGSLSQSWFHLSHCMQPTAQADDP